jgi:DNA-binding protein HU-beta
MIETLADRLGGKRGATEAVDAVIDTITRAVASGERVAITGFGVFERVARPARTGRNPRTGASVKIKKTTVPKFKAGQHFKDVVSGTKKLGKPASSSNGSTAKSTGSKATASKSTAKKAPAKSTVKKAPAKSSATKTAAKSTAKRSTTKAPSKASSTRKSSSTAKKSTATRTAKR